MITIDTTNLTTPHGNAYSVWSGDKKQVFLNDEPLEDVVYVNCDTGFAIIGKRNKKGSYEIANNTIVHEIVFGDMTVKPLND